MLKSQVILLVNVKQTKKVLSLISIILCLSACSQKPATSVEVEESSERSYQQAVDREQAIAKNDVWHAAKLNGASFRAIGQEPAWLIEFYPGEKIYLSRAYGEIIQTFNYQEPVTDKVKRRSVFKLKNQGKVIVEGKPCIDIMSGEKFETTVTVVIDEQILKGCGRSLY